MPDRDSGRGSKHAFLLNPQSRQMFQMIYHIQTWGKFMYSEYRYFILASLCLCRPFQIFSDSLHSNPQCCHSKWPRYRTNLANLPSTGKLIAKSKFYHRTVSFLINSCYAGTDLFQAPEKSFSLPKKNIQLFKTWHFVEQNSFLGAYLPFLDPD